MSFNYLNLDISNFRNIGISAHIDAGKTTTTERILYYTGKNHKMGEVHEGCSTMDWMDQEQERGITITSAATTVFWSIYDNSDKIFYKINIIDTPGHVDFTIEVERCMRVIDGVCMIYCSVSGLQSQSETVWRQSEKYNVSKLIFVNKMDRVGNNFYKIYEDLKFKILAKPLIIFIPFFLKDNFFGLIDLLKFKLIIWNENTKGLYFDYFDIPFDYLNLSIKWRDILIDSSIENDDFLLDKFLKNSLLIFDLNYSIRKKTVNNLIQPMLCGSAFKNKGIQCLLDCIVMYLPSPLDSEYIKTFNNGEFLKIKISEYKKFLALAFKIVNDPFIGQLIFFRVYTGKINVGEYIFNSNKNKKERLSRILRIHANEKNDIMSVSAGDIAAAVGLKTFSTGDTISQIGSNLILESISFPDPVISQSISVNSKLDEDKLFLALNKISYEDPSFKFFIDRNTNQIIINGMGELHLDIISEKIRRDYKIEISTEKPKVFYKESIKKSINLIEGKYIRQSGGRGQYGHVVINLEPNSRGFGFKFVNNIKGGSIPKEYISSIEKSFQESSKEGVLYGYPVTDIIIYLVDGSYHDVDSSENAFKIASSIAFKEGCKKAEPFLLEPIMIIDIEIPEIYVSNVLSDISSKRGDLLKIENVSDDYKILKCKIPLSEIFNYSTVLRSLTKGRGVYNMNFFNYSEVPENILKKI